MDEKPSENDKTVKFTKAELAMIDQGIAELDRGQTLTFQQARALARKQTKEWTETRRTSKSA